MEGDGGEHEMWETSRSARCSPSSSVASLRDVGGELDEQSPPAAEDRVFIAVAEEINNGKSTLQWAVQNLAEDGSKVVIAHVHSPARAIHEMGEVHYASMKPEEINKYRKLEREKAEKNIDEYALIAKCTRKDLVVDYEKVIIETDDVAEGLEELIALHGINKLVIGAAADQHYTKDMKTPKSKKALKLMETAAPSCKIWFTCNGHLICTREANENLLAISLPPAQSNTALLSVCSISSQMRSMVLKNEVTSSKRCTSRSLVESTMSDWDYFFGDWGRTGHGSSRTDDAASISEATAQPVIIGDANKLRPVMHSPTHEPSEVHFLLPACDPDPEEEELSVDEDMYDKFHEAGTETELLEEEFDEESNKRYKAEMDLLSALQRVKESENSYLHEVSQRKEIEKTLARQRLEIDEMKRRRYVLHDELQDSKKQKLMLEQRITQLESAAKDHIEDISEFFIKESCEESKKRRKSEMDLLSTLQRIKKMENLYKNEKMQRVDMEEKIARQRMEIEETKRQRDELYYELQDVKEQKLRLELTDVSGETNRRKNAERDLLSALRRVKDLEHWHLHEMKRREAMEETLARQKEEIQETKRQLEEIHDRHMTEIKCTNKVHEEKLAQSKRSIQELQAKYDKLLHEREIAVTEAEELRQKNKHEASLTAKTLNTDFSFFELQQATQGFDMALKISEGRFGSVYKGFLRNTTVAIKLLHPQSQKGQSEFHQEVAVLSRVRHPNLMTLIGACPEAFGMVYEFLPNGSLEDRLSCKKNTPPLTWKVRTRIIGEICSALTFIHSHKPHTIIHGDLKLDNILLDANFVSKLHICRLLKQYTTTKNTRGTLSAGELTPRSDVYSFGIIILRLLTGRSPQGIALIVEEAMENGHLHSILDASAGSWPFVQANQLAHLGLSCANLKGRHRPDLAGEVWGVIEPLTKAASLNAGQPLFAALSDDTHTPSYFVKKNLMNGEQEVMSDPHIAADGFTYEAEGIRGWLDGGHNTSPMTNLTLAHCELTPNRALRSAILQWQQQHGR